MHEACGLNRGIGSNSAGPFFAAAGRDDVSESASGGVFGSVAREHISSGGVVYGAAYEREGNTLRVLHRRAVSVDELRPLLNSKYVQSDAGACFADVKADLRDGRRVLFCGTLARSPALGVSSGAIMRALQLLTWSVTVSLPAACSRTALRAMANSLGLPWLISGLGASARGGVTLSFFFFFLRTEERSPFLRRNPPTTTCS